MPFEKMVGKGENAGYRYFPLFTTMFSEGIFLRVIWDCMVKG